MKNRSVIFAVSVLVASFLFALPFAMAGEATPVARTPVRAVEVAPGRHEFGSSVKLVDNAQVRFHTVIADDAPAPVRKGAAELRKYLDGGTPAAGEKTLPVEIRVERLWMTSARPSGAGLALLLRKAGSAAEARLTSPIEI